MPKNDTSNKLLDTVLVFGTAAGFIFLMSFIPSDWIGTKINDEVIDTISDTPVEINLSDEAICSETKTLSIIEPTNSQILPNDAFDRFIEVAHRIIAEGNFKDVKLQIELEAIGKPSDQMLSITFDNESGIYRAARSAFDKINKNITSDLGGFFSGETIQAEVRLTDEILLATTGEEFSLTGSSTKTIDLWDSMLVKPPTVFRLMIAPISTVNGNLNDYEITNMSIDYTCKEDSPNCQLILCTDEPNYYYCLLENLDQEAADSWHERSDL